MPLSKPFRIARLPANSAWCLLAPDGQIVTLADGRAIVSGPRGAIVSVLAAQGLSVARDGTVSVPPRNDLTR